MTVTPTYPGVYIEEIPSGVHTIIGVATSITAFVGRTKMGVTNTGVTLTSFGDFESAFGPLDRDYPLSYAVSDFFGNGGTQAIVVRLFHDAGAAAAAEVAAVATKSQEPDPVKLSDAVTAASDAIKNDASRSQDEKDGAAAVAKAASDEAAKPGATVDKVKTAAVNAAAAVTDTGTATLTNAKLALKAAGPGEWGNHLSVTVDKRNITDEVGKRYGLKTGGPLFNLSVYVDATLDKDGKPTSAPAERIQNVSLFAGAGERRLDRVLPRVSNLVSSAVTDFPDKEEDAGGANFPIADGDLGKADDDPGKALQFDGGEDSKPLTDANYLGDENTKTGIHGLDDVDLFNILCIPADELGGDTSAEVYGEALKYCVARRAMLIVDPPADWSNRVKLLSGPAAALGEVNLTGPDARNAFVYYPRVKMADPLLGGAEDTFPACGVIAGIFATTDAQRGVWVAPAGLDASLSGATPEVPLTDRENGVLNPFAINCIRRFPVFGTVLWGSRTMRGADQLADEYKYLPVRRMALFLEESLYRGTQWVVFQPNDEPLWALIRLNIGAFMNDLFRKGAFQGTKAQDAYFVHCDHSTTTQNDIDRGVVNIVVGFAPLKPAEFVIVQIQQITGSLNT
jgi:phage tail sheath protein FI